MSDTANGDDGVKPKRLIVETVFWLLVVFVGPFIPIESTRWFGMDSPITWVAGAGWFFLLARASWLVEGGRPHSGDSTRGCTGCGVVGLFLLGTVIGGGVMSSGCNIAHSQFRKALQHQRSPASISGEPEKK